MLNKLKAAYVGCYLIFCNAVAGIAIWKLLSTELTLAWAGTLLSAAPLAIGITLIMIKPVVARTSDHLMEVHLPILAGLIIALAGSYQADAVLPGILALISYLGFLGYVYWYSRYGREASDSLTVGQSLPDFQLTNLEGEAVTSSNLLTQPSVLIFYRGNWCPLCMAQIKEVARSYHQLESLGAQVILVSPQPHKYTRELANKFDVNFQFMTDSHNQAAKTLGIMADFGIPSGIEMMGYSSEAPMPTVIITDANGKVLWADETDNYRVRPEPETFLQVFQAQA